MSYSWKQSVSLLAVATAAFSYAGAVQAEGLIDSNSVNLATGQVSTPSQAVSIGGSGSGIGRSDSGSTQLFPDNYTGTINQSGTSLTVTLGGSTESFDLVSGVYVPSKGGASTLTCTASDCAYTMSDGTTAIYSRALTATAGIVANYATLSTITGADAEVITLTYRTTGTTRYPLSVSSSLGWMLKYHVAGDSAANFVPVKIEAVNTAVDYCDPAALTCGTPSQTWPYVLISATGPTNALGQHITLNGTFTNPTSIVSPLGITKSLTYYGSGTYANWVNTVVIAGSTWTYGYSVASGVQTTTVTDPNGGVRTITYDTTNKRVLSETDPMGRKTGYTYYTVTDLATGKFKDALWQVIAPDATFSGATPTGGYTEYLYDGRGNAITTRQVQKGGSATISNSATYSASPCANAKICNKPLTTTDAAGNVTTYTYNASNGEVATVTSPAVSGVAPQTRYTYVQQTPYIKNSAGSLVASTPVWRLTETSSCMTTASCSGTADERKTVIAYANNNVLPTTITVARGDANLSAAASAGNIYRTTTLSYDAFGNVASSDGPIAGDTDKSFYFYDGLSRQTGMIGPDPDGASALPRHGVIVGYNNDGQVQSTATGAVTGTTQSNLNAMATQETSTTGYSTTSGLPVYSNYYPAGASTPQMVVQTSYDTLFRTDCVAQRLNPTIFSSLPASACTPGAAGSDGPDRIVRALYNKNNQIVSTISGYGVLPRQDMINTYNANGTLATVADDKGNLTSYSYDLFNRAIKACLPNKTSALVSSTSDCEQTSFTGALATGRTLRDGQTVTIAYDAANRVSTITGAVSETYTYNNFSQVKTHAANGVTETYGYDAVNGLTSDAQPAGTVTYAYDVYGRRAQLNYPAYAGATFNLTYSYYNNGALLSQSTAYNGAAAVQRAQFTLDTQERLGSYSLGPSAQVTITPAYDSASRLQSLTNNLAGTTSDAVWNYSYTNAAEIKTRSQAGSTAYNYSAANTTTAATFNGLNQVVQATSTGTTAYGYDDRGNLTSEGTATYTYNTYNLLTATNGGATLTYDASNRLASLAKSGATTKFLYDGSDLIAEYDGSGALLRRYVHGPGDDNPLVWFEGTNDASPRYLTADQQGSITAVTDATGAMLAINTYNEYGLPAPGNLGRFQYTGQTWLPEVGLYYYKARMYAPSLGRFLQSDPVGYGDGMNTYAYVHGDPVNSSDSSGLGYVQVQHGWYCANGSGTNSSSGTTTVTCILRPRLIWEWVDEAPSYQPSHGGSGGGGWGNAAASAADQVVTAIKSAGEEARKALCSADYYSVNINAGLELGVTFGVVVDRYGNIFGGGGGYAGLPGGQVGAYKLNTGRENASSAQEINSVVSGWSLSGNVGLYAVVSVSGNTSGLAGGFAFSPTGPTADVALTYTKQVPQSFRGYSIYSSAKIMKKLNEACGR